MKKRLLTLALIAGGLACSTCALAQTESTLTTVYSQDYESASVTDWTSQSGQVSLVTGDATYGNYAKFYANSSSGDRTAYWKAFSGDLTEGYIDADLTTEGYNIDFDILLGRVNASRTQQFVVMTTDPSSLTANSAYSGTDYLFSLSQKNAWSTYWHLNDLTNVANTDSANLAYTSWYHVCLNVTKTGVTYTITNGSETIATGSNGATYDELPEFVGFFAMTGRSGSTSYGYQYYDNIEVTKYVEGIVANDPTIALTGIDGTSRTYTITCADGETIYYQLPNSTEYVEGSGTSIQVTTSDSGTLSAYTTNGSATSNTVSVTVEATQLTLATPTITRSSYSSGYYTVTLASNQSNVGLNPSATIYYSIDGATAVAGTSASVPEGSTITAYATADGYTNSENATWESKARPSNTKTIWTQDYRYIASEIAGTTTTSDSGLKAVTLSDEADFTVNGTSFYNITAAGGTDVDVTTNVGLSSSANISFRTYGNNSGLLFQSGTRYLGIQNLEVGQTIVITCNDIVPTASYGATLEDGMSVTGEYYFTATATEASICIVKNTSYDYIYTITVLDELSSVSKTLGASQYGTFSADFNAAVPDGITVYTAALNDDESALVLTEVDGTVIPANNGVVIAGEANGVYEFVESTETAATLSDDNIMKPNVEATAVGSGWYGLLKDEATAAQMSGGTLAANTAYFTLTTSSAKSLRIVTAGEATAISTVEAATADSDAPCYNVLGQRVNASAKGLVIKNGKKYVNK